MQRSLTVLTFALIQLAGLATVARSSGDWSLTGWMGIPRQYQTTTLLPDGRVLAAGGLVGGVATATAELYDPSTGTWRATGSMAVARAHHTATLLRSGEVLVVGGAAIDADGVNALRSYELFDFRTEQWTGSENVVPRYSHTATLLESGKVLLVGGFDDMGVLDVTELFDPATGSWDSAGTIGSARAQHTATLLPGGQVAVLGGIDDVGVASRSAEIYAPANGGSWSPMGAPLQVARSEHTATLLSSGEVLVVGGGEGAEVCELSDSMATCGAILPPEGQRVGHSAVLLPDGTVLITGGEPLANSLSQAEIFDPDPDPVANTWRPAGAATLSRVGQSATLLPSGKALVVGAGGGSSELFNARSRSWRFLEGPDGLAAPRTDQTATLLPSGKVLIVGMHASGMGSSSSGELYDPVLGSSSMFAGLPIPRRSGHTATLLQSGKVLVAGGVGVDEVLVDVELYAPDTDQWTVCDAQLKVPRADHTATVLPSGQVLVIGGHEGSTYAELHDCLGRQDLEAPIRRARHTATPLRTGKVLVVGGVAAGGALASAELFDPEVDFLDPAAEPFAATGSLSSPRSGHTATALPSGEALVVGGDQAGGSGRVELYDPATGTWRLVASLNTPRTDHSATLLGSGEVLVAGGYNSEGPVASVEIYDRAGGDLGVGAWREIQDLAVARSSHTATLLRSGEVLIAGGGDGTQSLSSLEGYLPVQYPATRRPVINDAFGEVAFDSTALPLRIEGDFRTDFEASDSSTRASAVNASSVRLRSLINDEWTRLIPDPVTSLHAGESVLEISDLPPLHPGPYLLEVTTAAVPSEPWPSAATESTTAIEVVCGVEITEQPLIPDPPSIGQTATFDVEALGGRTFRWQRCVGDAVDCAPEGAGWADIPGAEAHSYTTPPLTGQDSGSRYRAVVSSGCTSVESQAAVLTIEDTEAPQVAVVSPDGGEFWQLSEDPQTPRTEMISWAMSDNVRICQVEVFLMASTDGGATFNDQRALDSIGPGGACVHPGVVTTDSSYPVPATAPSGQAGSLYKIRVEVTDQAGNRELDESDNPFFLVEPNNESVKTLIFWHRERMGDLFGQNLAALEAVLQDLANHERVSGRVIDLSLRTELAALYENWDNDSGNADRANFVLFGCEEIGSMVCQPDEAVGIQDHVRELLGIFTGVEYIILVGDDRIIPMARVKDETILFSEKNYPSDPSDPSNPPDLTPGSTTVAQALADDRYLSDDPLAMDIVIGASDLSLELDLALDLPEEVRVRPIVPELGIGRLVESPAEIIGAITTFLSHDGILDLTVFEREVLVTGYDFLTDAGDRIGQTWRFPQGEPGPLTVRQLLGDGWDEGELAAALCADDGSAPKGILSLNGHATHYEEGVPILGGFSVHGLDSSEIVNHCLPSDLAGSVAYAVGCHSGLSVAGTVATQDHPLDLPQAMAQLGVSAYLANTGYGWGLLSGIGYAERLVELLTEELTRVGTVVIGDAVRNAKRLYFLEVPRFDPYDEKSLLQWTLFGFPMYAVKTGIGTEGSIPPSSGPAPAAEDLPLVEQVGPVAVTRRFEAIDLDGVDGTSHLLQLALGFGPLNDYTKHDAMGQTIDVEGCPDAAGCYYTLGSLGPLIETDHPLQPYFLYSSQLAGTSQHGVLWKGGIYEQETGWIPVFAELTSNGGDGSDHGAAPRHHNIKPAGVRLAPPLCEASDLEVSNLVVPTSEAVWVDEDTRNYVLERLFRTVAVEIFYFNNPVDSAENCDRTGPVFAEPPCEGYHQVDGGTVHWAFRFTDDPGEVWRVVVVYNDGTFDAQDRGAWVPVELSEDAGTWRASVAVRDSTEIVYVVQAVDRRGNVSWLDPILPAGCVPQPPPIPMPAASGVDLGLPGDVVAPLPDVTIEITDATTMAVPGEDLTYTITASNIGESDVAGATVNDAFPSTLSCVWTCIPESGADCSAGPTAGDLVDTVVLPSGSRVVYSAECEIDPAATGTLVNTATISLPGDPDPNPDNDTASEGDTVLQPRVDLAITKDDGVAIVVPGGEVVYSITVTNTGPSAVTGAMVDDVFPAAISSCDWTCAGAGGASCSTMSGSGDIHQTVDLPVGSIATFTATCLVDPLATGTLGNTATVSPPAGVPDTDPSNDTDTDVDSVDPPPTVVNVHSVAASGGGQLSSGESVVAAITQLTVRYSEAVNQGGEDSSYQLLEAGPNNSFETEICGAVAGDDVSVAFEASYDPPSLTATLDLVGEQPAPAGRYCLVVCTAVEDLSGIPLDGDDDGIGGDPFLRQFLIETQHRLMNPNFDQSLAGWDLIGSPFGDVVHILDDEDAASTSGSASASNFSTPGDNVVLSQCLLVAEDEELFFGGKVRITDPQVNEPSAYALLEVFALSDCMGSPSLQVTSDEQAGASGGLWLPFLGGVLVDFAASSARISYVVDVSTLGNFEVDFDALFLFRTPSGSTIFADGFESGDTSSWSNG